MSNIFKKWFGKRDSGGGGDKGAPPEVRWIDAHESPWGVPVIDLRPFALTMLSTSKDPRMASNAVSFMADDGTGFADETPPVARTIDCDLRFSVDRALVEGALFQPRTMEEKWALYFHRGRVLCIRSWTRQLRVAADVRIEGDEVVIGPLHGAFVDDSEAPERSVRMLDFMLRSHALQETVPAPLSEEPSDVQVAALECFSLWGNRALYATHHLLARSKPSKPLRSDSLFHIAVARGDRDAAARLLPSVPIDLIARDGLTVAQWALASRDHGMLEWLLDHGCPVDARSTEGATALMNAVQAGNLDAATLLLNRGADMNARDERGFTAMHRAAEMGHIELVRLLLERSADPTIEAQGWTPKRLAEQRQRVDIVALLSK